MRWLNFILSHSIFISLCALALCYQSFILLHIQPRWYIYAFIFCATLCSYNFYWLVSKYSFSKGQPVAVFLKTNISYVIIFLLSAAGMVISFLFITGAFVWVMIAILLTLLYSLPLWPVAFARKFRKAGFLKTTLLAFTWAYVTVIIPAIPVLETSLQPIAVLFIARFFFMLMLCVIFDMRDMAIDKIHGLHSLATDVSKPVLKKIMLFAFALFMAAGILVRYQFNDIPQLLAFTGTGVVVWFVYRLSFKKQGYLFYYFLVDGLMLVSAALTFLAAWF